MKYILERLAEASTWRGIMAFLTGVGVVISPDLQAAIIATGLAVMGLIGVATKDKS
jgi:hypothetical protein